MIRPTRDRPERYQRCVESIRSQVDGLVTVAHHPANYAVGTAVLPYDREPPNISRMWRLGLDACSSLAAGLRVRHAHTDDLALREQNTGLTRAWKERYRA